MRRIVLPQIMPGVLSGAIIVFALAASAFATPAIIGGRRLKVASTLAYDEFLNTLNWPLGAAVAVLLLVALVLIIVGSNRADRAPLRRGVPMSRNGPLALAFHALFIGFMLAPIVIVCLVAFTPEGYLSLPTNGFSLRWFRAIADYPEFVRAFWVSLWLGALSSSIALRSRCRRRLPSRAIASPAATRWRRFPVAADDPACRAGHRVPALLHLDRASAARFAGLMLAHVIVVLPFALRLVLAAATGMDRAVEHAAVSLGAGRLHAVPPRDPAADPARRRQRLGARLHPVFDELTMTVFIASPGTETLPVRMFLYIQDNIDPLVTSVSACVISLTMTVLILLDRFYGLDRLLVGKSDPGR